MLHSEDLESVLQSLLGRVFHATTIEAFDQINSSGFIVPNTEERFISPFGRYNGYFKNKGCISFFDYRANNQLMKHINKCLPTQIFERSKGIAILELSPQKYKDLISWENWKKEDSVLQIVPYVETGIKGKVSLEDICSINVIERPSDYVTHADLEAKIALNNQ